MDIKELLSFKPVTAPKRPAPSDDKEEEEEEIEDDDNPNDSYEKRAAKRRKKQKAESRIREKERLQMLEVEAANVMAAAAAENDGDSGLTEEQRQRIKDLVDNADDGDNNVENLDETTMKKLILAFEKKALKNQELRIKFPDDPSKFMESEVDLHDAIQELRSLATAPDLYPILVELGCVQSFLGLLSHENTDLSVAVVDLIQELTDIDTLQESGEEGAASLIDSLQQHDISALLIQNLERLNDSVREENNGIHNTLAIFENLIEFRPEICKEAGSEQAGLLAWLVKRLKVKVPFDDNKLYARYVEVENVSPQRPSKASSIYLSKG